MTTTGEKGCVDDWRTIASSIDAVVAGLSDAELDMPRGSGMTARETVHHLAEANIVAASMVIAALGSSGALYDWSWLYPNTEWVSRMRYASLPIHPAIETLRALTEQVSNMIDVRDDAIICEVTLFDQPGGDTYKWTVEKILTHEAEHAREHLSELIA